MKLFTPISARAFVAGLALSLAFAADMRAVVIAENLTFNAGSGSNVVAIGQSLTTPGGGPWVDIQFNFYLSGGGAGIGSPFAEGTLFVLSQEFTGTPGALSNGTPGFLASTNTISGGVWQFAGLTLQPNTEYYFLMVSTSTENRAFHSGSVLNGGVMYGNVGAFSYFASPGQDTAFTLQGTAADVPEPGTVSLFAAGIALAWTVRRRRSATGSLPNNRA